MYDILSGGLLGAFVGLRHALEPDHLTAVSTLVIEARSPRGGAVQGLLWGLGHGAMLLICGLALCLLRTRMPPPLASLCEGAVSVMLVVLGARAIRRAFAQGSEGTLARRPLLIGMVHGLAGSGALAALALSRMPSLPAQVAYILLFGLGSIAGMGLLSGLAGWPLLHLMRRRRTARVVSAITGSLSLMLGLAWPWT